MDRRNDLEKAPSPGNSSHLHDFVGIDGGTSDQRQRIGRRRL
jgi:hypothetical protein